MVFFMLLSWRITWTQDGCAPTWASERRVRTQTAVPGALVPALLEDNRPIEQLYSARDFAYLN
jgi:hypothetical protein